MPVHDVVILRDLARAAGVEVESRPDAVVGGSASSALLDSEPFTEE